MTLLGCGTTRWTDTGRAATEQLLISDAMDRAVSRLDFRALAGRDVFVDTTHIKGVTDSEYLISTLRQHMLATGCILRDTKDTADYVAEVRVGAVGTDRNEMMFGIPSVSIPVPVPVTGVPTSIPEMQFAKKTKQRAVVKMAVFAYNAKSGRPVWQSGAVPVQSTAKDVWIAGAGPFQTGTIYERATFAGDEIDIPLIDFHSREERPVLAVADDAYFVDELAEKDEEAAAEASQTPSPAQTAQAEPKSPPKGPDQEKKSAVDPKVIPASNETPAEAPPQQPKTAAPRELGVSGQESSSEPPAKITPSLALRLPAPGQSAETGEESAASPPLPNSDDQSTSAAPRILNLEGVTPIPLRLPQADPAGSGISLSAHSLSAHSLSEHSLGLPPLPQSETSRARRAPASLTSAPILP